MQVNNKNKNLVYYSLITIMYILLFQNIIQKYIGIFRYFDEALAMITFPIILFNILKKKTLKIKKYDFYILVSLIIIGFIGIYSSLKYEYQPIYIALLDMILIYKFFLVYYLGSYINNNGNLYNYKNRII